MNKQDHKLQSQSYMVLSESVSQSSGVEVVYALCSIKLS